MASPQQEYDHEQICKPEKTRPGSEGEMKLDHSRSKTLSSMIYWNSFIYETCKFIAIYC